MKGLLLGKTDQGVHALLRKLGSHSLTKLGLRKSPNPNLAKELARAQEDRRALDLKELELIGAIENQTELRLELLRNKFAREFGEIKRDVIEVNVVSYFEGDLESTLTHILKLKYSGELEKILKSEGDDHGNTILGQGVSKENYIQERSGRLIRGILK